MKILVFVTMLFVGCGVIKKSDKESDDKATEAEADSGEDGATDDVTTDGGEPDDKTDNNAKTTDAANFAKYVSFALSAPTAGLTDEDESTEPTPVEDPSTGEESGEEEVTTAKEPDNGSNIFGIDKDGNSEEIVFSGSMFQMRKMTPTPRAVFFFPAYGASLDGDKVCHMVILVRSSNTLECITDYDLWGDPRTIHPEVQFSSNGEYVAIEVGSKAEGFGGTSQIIRIRFPDEGPMEVKNIYSEDGYPEQWRMNSLGDVAIQFSPNTERTLWVVPVEGETVDLGTAEYVRCLIDGVGSRSTEFTYYNSNAGDEFYKVAKNGEGIYEKTMIYTVQESDDLNFIFWGCDSLISTEDHNFYAMNLPDTGSPSTGDDTDYDGNVHIIEFTLDPTAARRINVPGMRRATKIYKEKDSSKLILVGFDDAELGKIVTLDPTDSTVTSVIEAKDYKFYQVFKLGEALFITAQRVADEKFVTLRVSKFDGSEAPTESEIKIPGVTQVIPLY